MIPILILLLRYVDAFNIDTQSAYIVSNNNGLFGFSTALHRSKDTPYVLVGAPNAESGVFGVKKPGVVYKCPVESDSLDLVQCDSMIDVFNDGKNMQILTTEKKLQNSEEKSGQFLGVTLDSTDDIIVACAHRYVNIFDSDEKEGSHQLIGRCLVANSEFEEYENFVVKPCDNGLDSGYSTFGLCQAGTSLFMQKADPAKELPSAIILGAPGLGEAVGGGFLFNPEKMKTPSDRKFFFPPTRTQSAKTAVQYRGYNVIKCNMENVGETYIMAGPRADLYRGKLVFYVIYEGELEGYKILGNFQSIVGKQIGSYFGHSLVCTDVNNDGYDDLIVGAPWYTDYSVRGNIKADTGRVYIYYGSKIILEADVEEPSTITGEQPDAAFGFSMTAAGDTNGDSFQDVFIGAPYYNDGIGAVFLYLGSKDGLQSSYSQKITPQVLNIKLDNMLTFGWSISAGKDMDSNGYPDVAIGAYKSGHVVFLKSTAIIDVIPKFVFSSTKINPKNATLAVAGVEEKVAGTQLQICLLYDGNKTDAVIQVNLTVFLDANIDLNRVYFDYKSPSSHWETSLRVNLSDTTTTCSLQKNVYLHDGIQDVRPVEVSVSAELAATAESFNARKVLNQKVIRETKGSIAIITKCNEESGKCKVDLDLIIPDYTFEKSDKYPAVVYNKVNYVYPRFVIRNKYKGLYNYTYNAYVNITLPKHLQYEEVRSKNIGEKVSCKSIDDNKVKCKIPSLSPLNDPMNPEQEFILKVKLVNVTAPIDQVIKAVVKPSEPSVEENNDNNSGELTIAIKELADLVVRGGATQAKVAFNNKYTLVDDIIGSEDIDIRHVIQIHLNEESEREYVEDVKLNVYWPMKTHGKSGRFILPIEEILITESSSGSTVRCDPTIEELYKSTGSIIGSKPDTGDSGEDSGQIIITDDNSTLYLVDTEAVTDDGGKALPTISEYSSIDCSRDKSRCVKLVCNIERIDVSKTAQDLGGLKMSIVAKVHEANLYDVKQLNITSFAEVESVGGGLVPPYGSSLSLKTELYASTTKSRNLVWIIVGGVLGGILLLLLIVLILWKMGFFKRQQPPTLTADKVDEQVDYN